MILRGFERRYDPIAAREGTQRRVSFYLISVVAAVIAVICWRGSTEDVKNLYTTLLPFLGLVLGFWLGSSKGAADNREQLNKMLNPTPGTTTIAPPATVTLSTNEGDIHDPKN